MNIGVNGMKRILALILAACLGLLSVGCSSGSKKERVLIYTGTEEYRNEYFQKRLGEQFPDYEVVIEYIPSGTLATKLMAEGKQTACDIAYDIDYTFVEKLSGIFADLSSYDMSMFTDDVIPPSKTVMPHVRNGGCIAINPKVLEEKGLPKPTSYQDLLDPKYKGLISMPDPVSSGTGYMFLRALVNAWGEDEAFDYFSKLKTNVKQFTSSGSGPVNALVLGEAAVGLAMTAQTVTEINNNAGLELTFFEEGSPFSVYGYAMIDGKQTRQCVKDVFDFFYTTLVEEDKAAYFPEKIYKDKDFTIKNYPTDIHYADMSNNTAAEKERLLEKWKNL